MKTWEFLVVVAGILLVAVLLFQAVPSKDAVLGNVTEGVLTFVERVLWIILIAFVLLGSWALGVLFRTHGVEFLDKR